MEATSQETDTGDAPVSVGRTRWRRFTSLMVPTLGITTLLFMGVLNGTLPISIAAEGKQRVKVEVKEMRATGYGAFPQFFQTQDGNKHTVVVIGMSGLRAQGLCASGKVDTPLGSYVLRFATKPGGQPLKADDLKMAVENIDGAEAFGKSIWLNRFADTPDGTPADSGPPGTLPVTIKSLLVNIHSDIRWVTVSGMKLSALDLTMGPAVEECF